MPGQNGIPKGKKRYNITLTVTTVNRMHAYLGKNHVPKSFMSSMLDELLLDILKTFDELEASQKRKGAQLGFGDMLSAVGNVIQERESKQEKLL